MACINGRQSTYALKCRLLAEGVPVACEGESAVVLVILGDALGLETRWSESGIEGVVYSGLKRRGQMTFTPEAANDNGAWQNLEG